MFSSVILVPAPSISATNYINRSDVDIILPRHEQALVHEADAYARTTGKGWRMSRYQRPWRHQPCNRSCNCQL